MFKALTPDSYLIRPFRVHKLQAYQYTIDGDDNPPEITIGVAANESYASEVLSFAIGNLYTVGSDQQIGGLFASQDPVNPDGNSVVILNASLNQLFYTPLPQQSRYNHFELTDAVYVFSMAQRTYGEQIYPGSFIVRHNSCSIYDDAQGNLYASGSDAILEYWRLNDASSVLTASFSRSTPAYYFSASLFYPVDADVMRTAHYVSGATVPSLLIESASIQYINTSTIFTSSYWSSFAAYGSLSYTSSIIANETASVFTVNSGSSGQFISHTINSVQNDVLTVSCIIQNVNASQTQFGLYGASSGFGDGGLCTFDWTQKTASMATPGTSLGTPVVEALSGNTYKVFFSCKPTDDVALQAFYYPTAGAGTGSSTLHYLGVETSKTATSPIKSNNGITSRTTDQFSLPFIYVPKRTTIITEIVDAHTTSNSGSVFIIGSGSDSLSLSTENGYYVARYSRLPRSVSSSINLGDLTGQTLRFRTEVYDDASVQLIGGISGGVETEGIRSDGMYVTGSFTSRVNFGGSTTSNMGLISNTISQGSGSSIGRILYSLGLAVVSKFDSGSTFSMAGINLHSGSVLEIEYRASQTIYEHQIICTMEPNEFNYTINPSIYKSGSAVTGSGKLLDNMASGSLTPYITSLGLYNSQGELMAVGKFPHPIKRASESQQTIVIRFDT